MVIVVLSLSVLVLLCVQTSNRHTLTDAAKRFTPATVVSVSKYIKILMVFYII